MVDQIYPNELQLNKANFVDTEAPFWTCCVALSRGAMGLSAVSDCGIS